jgi:hypothetical protein
VVHMSYHSLHRCCEQLGEVTAMAGDFGQTGVDD